MKVLKNAGKYRIIHITPDVLKIIEDAGRTCYQTKDKITDESAEKFCRMIMTRGHHSVIEHSVMIIEFSDICRGFTHEQVRHRLTGISQESTRYVDESEFRCVVPPNHDENALIISHPIFEEDEISLKEWFEINESVYRQLREKGWKPQDARQTLPIAIKSQIVISANLREWRHIFSMRCDKYAHWEIRRVMCRLLHEVQRRVPVLFEDFVEIGRCEYDVPYYGKTGAYKEPGMPIVQQ